MGIVQAQANMSLDGYVAKQDNTIGRLFDWLQNGEVAIPTPAGDFTVHLTPPSAEHWQRWVPSLGALVCGRTLFDVTDGWQGRHTLDVPVVVVTHQVPRVGRGASGRAVLLRHRRGGGGGRTCPGPRPRPRHRDHRGHHRPAVPGPRAAGRGGHRPGAGGDGRGQSPLLRPALIRRCDARQPDGLRPG